MILRIDEEAIGCSGKITSSPCLDDVMTAAEQDAATLSRQRLPGMGGNDFDDSLGDVNRYNASTTIAIPMPPPMHNAAMP